MIYARCKVIKNDFNAWCNTSSKTKKKHENCCSFRALLTPISFALFFFASSIDDAKKIANFSIINITFGYAPQSFENTDICSMHAHKIFDYKKNGEHFVCHPIFGD